MRYGVSAVALAAVFFSMSARADVITQTDAIDPATPNWSDHLTYDQFDPAQGSLTGVNLTLTGNLTADLKIENREAAARTVGANVNGSVSAQWPNGAYAASVAPSLAAGANLAAYDGVTDFAGASGRSYTGLAASQTAQSGGYFDAATSAAFTGAGAVAFPVTARASANVSGAANLAGQVQSALGANGTLNYAFTPAGTGTSTNNGSYDYYSSSADLSGEVASAGLLRSLTNNLVTSPVQTQGVASQTTGWSEALTFDKFDPSLGALSSINVTLKSKLTAGQKGENLTGQAAGITISQGDSVSLKRADGSLIQKADTVLATTTRQTGAFDGAADFAGASGFALDDLTLTQTVTATLSAASDLLLFTGLDDITLSILSESFGAVSGPGSFWFDLAADADALVSLSYTYLPTGVTPQYRFELLLASTPEPASLALFGLGALALFARRRA